MNAEVKTSPTTEPTPNPNPGGLRSRRSLFTAGLLGTAATAAATLAGSTRQASANPGQSPGRLAVVFLRGGMDGLSAVVPYTEGAYYDARPGIAVPDSAVLDLDGQFGLHPALTSLHSLFTAGRLSVVVGAGHQAGDRSHFTAQDLWEYGSPTAPSDFRGWLGRHLAATASPDDSIFRSLTMGNNVNLSLRGVGALGIPGIQSFGLGGQSGLTAGRDQTFELLYAGEERIDTTGIAALEAANVVSTLAGSNSADKTTQTFRDAATLFDADLGTEVITLNIGGWDTHDAMGTHDSGEMRDHLLGLDEALGNFQADLDAGGHTDVTTVVMTEFGRRVAENGSGGTDHGWATAMFVLGDAAAGGVFGAAEWAGLAPAVVGNRGDVVPGVDCLDVLGDVVSGVLGGNPQSALAGHQYQPVGVIGS